MYVVLIPQPKEPPHTSAPAIVAPWRGDRDFSLFLATYILRLLDRFLGTRLSFYGWALYFGNAPDRIDDGCWTNVCIRCGSGHPSDRLLCVLPFLPAYRCPACGTLNLFTDDKHYRRP